MRRSLQTSQAVDSLSNPITAAQCREEMRKVLGASKRQKEIGGTVG